MDAGEDGAHRDKREDDPERRAPHAADSISGTDHFEESPSATDDR
jgi:hypothetical protein